MKYRMTIKAVYTTNDAKNEKHAKELALMHWKEEIRISLNEKKVHMTPEQCWEVLVEAIG